MMSWSPNVFYLNLYLKHFIHLLNTVAFDAKLEIRKYTFVIFLSLRFEIRESLQMNFIEIALLTS